MLYILLNKLKLNHCIWKLTQSFLPSVAGIKAMIFIKLQMVTMIIKVKEIGRRIVSLMCLKINFNIF